MFSVGTVSEMRRRYEQSHVCQYRVANLSCQPAADRLAVTSLFVQPDVNPASRRSGLGPVLRLLALCFLGQVSN